MPPMAAIIIPARWGSSRFPGKPLADIAGKSLLQHVWERSRRSRLARRLIIATDDLRIARAAFDFGAEVALTSRRHPSGTDRIAEIAAKLRSERIIVNVQGDEPFIQPRLIDRLIQAFDARPEPDMVTAAAPITEPSDFHDPNVVKVVTDGTGRAIYFSRASIPFPRQGRAAFRPLRHIGIYAFRRKFLLHLVQQPPSPLERTECLEQLRALELGARIHVLRTSSFHFGVDVPAQAAKASELLARSLAKVHTRGRTVAPR